MLGPRRSMVATAQDTPAQVEQSLPLRTLSSWDEAHAKHAEIAENGTVKVCVTNTIGIDVEEGRVTIKVHQDEDKSRYMSGPKLIFLLLCVYHKSIALLVVPTQPSGACFSLYFLVRWVPCRCVQTQHLRTTVALDQNIVATALPVIASYFNSLDSATWIVSAHFLTVSDKRHFERISATQAISSTTAS